MIPLSTGFKSFICACALNTECIYHIYAAMLTIMDLVVSDNRAAVCPDLDSCQSISVDVVSFDEASAITENVNSTLVTIKNGIAPVFGQNNKIQDKLHLHTGQFPI